MKISILMTGLFFLFVFQPLMWPTVSAPGPTYVQGFISGDTTWDVSGSPYVVIGDVTVDSGATLTVSAGTTVLFNEARTLYVAGTLLVEGTSSVPVVFESNATAPSTGDWDGIQVQLGGATNMTNCRILNATWGITLKSNGNFIRLCTISHNSVAGVQMNADGNTLESSNISNNGVGIYLFEARNNVVTENNVTNNGIGISHILSSGNTIRNNSLLGNADLAVQTVGSVDIQYNYFGTTDLEAIERAIYWAPDANYENPLPYRDSGALYVNGTSVWSFPQVLDRGLIINGDLTILSSVQFSNGRGDNYIQVNGDMSADGASFASSIGPFTLLYINKSQGWVNGSQFLGLRGLGVQSDLALLTNSTLESGEAGAIVRGTTHSQVLDLKVANNSGTGIQLTWTNDARVEGCRLWNNSQGIGIGGTGNIVIRNKIERNFNGMVIGGTGHLIEENWVSDNTNYGIKVGAAEWVNVSGNTLEANKIGIYMANSERTTVVDNAIANNTQHGLYLIMGYSNVIYHNEFLTNAVQGFDDDTGSSNRWYQFYPTGGNYWSDYTGADSFSGPMQNILGSDGIGDTPYPVDANTRDIYPLMRKPNWSDFQPPVVEYVRINGMTSVIIPQGTSNVTLTARGNDTVTGGSDVGGANYTYGSGNWPSNPMAAIGPLAPVREFEATVVTSFLPVGSYDLCVYAWDVAGNQNLTGECAELTVANEIQEPEVLGVRVQGQSHLSIPLSSAPADLSLTAFIDDTFRGNSDVGGANYTSGPYNWASAKNMTAIDGTYNSPNETVSAGVSTPSANGTYYYCVYGWDQWNNSNTTGQCVIVEILDDVPPEVFAVRIDGLPVATYSLGDLPPSLNISAIVDDSSEGMSAIGGANVTQGTKNWSSSMEMLPEDSTFDSSNESVYQLVPSPSGIGTYLYCVYGRDNRSNGGFEDRCAVLMVTANIPPTAVIEVTPSTSGFIGDMFNFNGSGSFDPDGTVVSWSWKFGDGESATGKLVTHAYSAKGLFTVTLTVTDDAGASNNTTVDISIVNRPPVANAGPDQIAFKNMIVTLEGRASFDPDSDPINFTWTQISGTIVVLNGANTPSPTFTPTTSDVYSFRLTVDDSVGGFSNDTVNVTVSNRIPVAEAGPHRTVQKGALATLNGTASYDPDGDPLAYAWTQVAGPSVSLVGENTAIATFIPTKAGTYAFELIVDDGDGGTDSDSIVVTVWSLSPIATFKASTLETEVGKSIEFDGSDSSDPDGIVVEYTFEFGDGNSLRGFSPIVNHSYTTVGSYVVSLTVVDDDGNTSSAMLTVNATMALNDPPVANMSIMPTTTGDLDTIFLFDGLNSTDPDGNVVSYLWEFGDGRSSLGSQTIYSYQSKGTFTVVLTVTDDDGATNSTSVEVTIVNRAPAIISSSPMGESVSILSSERLTFGVEATDPDLDDITYTWSVDGIAVGQSPFYEFKGSTGTYTVNVTVSDGSLQAWREWTVTVKQSPEAFPWWLVVLVLSAIIIMLLVFMFRRREKEEEELSEDTLSREETEENTADEVQS